MKDKELEEKLVGLRTEFKPFFKTRLMAKIENKKDLVHWPSAGQLAFSCFCIVGFCLLAIYFQDGSLDRDALLGISGASSDEMFDLIDYYE